MEDLISELLGAVTEHLSEMSESIDIDKIMQGATDAIQSTIDSLTNSGAEIDESTKQSILTRILGSFDGGDTSSIIENLHIIAENPLGDMDAGTDMATQGMNFTSGNEVPANGSQIPFTSIGCWDECFATVKDHGKRLSCGYNL